MSVGDPRTPFVSKVQIEDASGNVLGINSDGSLPEAGSQVDDAAFTPATGRIQVIGAFADEVGPDSVDEGDAGAVRMTLTRGLHVNPRNSSGTELDMNSGVKSAATLRVVLATDQPSLTNGMTVGGAAADGAVVAGNPVLMGGQDGTNAQSILTDTTGRQVVVGAAAAAAAVAGNPVMGGVYDGTNAQYTPGTTTGAFVSGNVASDIPVTANPLLGGGRASTATPSAVSADGDAVAGWLTRTGATVIAGTDGATSRPLNMDSSGSVFVVQSTASSLKVQAVGSVASLSADSGNPMKVGGVFTTNANQSAASTGNRVDLQTDPAGCLRVAPQRPTAADIVTGYLQHTSTTGAATVLTVAAGRTWVGVVTVSVAASKAAAATGNGLVSALIATAGTNVSPAAATVLAVSARIGANAATGTTGTSGSNSLAMKMTITAPAGNSVTLSLASTLTSTTEGAVDASCFGVLQ